MENIEISLVRLLRNFPIPRFFFCSVLLLYEFSGVPLKPFLALQAAEMERFAFISNFELRSAFVQYHAADWVSKHILVP
jgi:hypothetical protein